MNLNRIFVVADRDDKQQLALRAALDLVRGTAATISFTGFVHDPIVEQPKLMAATAARKLRSNMISERKRTLAEAAVRHAASGVQIESEVVWAKDIGAWIKENVDRRTHDVLIKSGHRSEGVFYTPTDWQLLRECPIPVLIARDRVRKSAGRVLATVDLGSEESVQKALNRRVLAVAADLAQRLGAELHVLYAIPVSVLAQDLDLVDGRALERRVRRSLATDVAALAAEYGIPAKHVTLRAGPPERVIDGVASKLKASLVVMGTLGRKGVKGRLLGNTAERVLHANRSNVLALRPDT